MRSSYKDIGTVENLLESKGFKTFTISAIIEKLLKDENLDVSINCCNASAKKRLNSTFGPSYTVALFKGGNEQKGYYESDNFWEAFIMAVGEALWVLPEHLKPKKIDPKLFKEDKEELILNEKYITEGYTKV